LRGTRTQKYFRKDPERRWLGRIEGTQRLKSQYVQQTATRSKTEEGGVVRFEKKVAEKKGSKRVEGVG